MKPFSEDKTIFVTKGGVYNMMVNAILAHYCKKANISVYDLRHTHALLMVFAGASAASVDRRLGHSNMTPLG